MTAIDQPVESDSATAQAEPSDAAAGENTTSGMEALEEKEEPALGQDMSYQDQDMDQVIRETYPQTGVL